jgi:peptidyl-dipeptidase Dcp
MEKKSDALMSNIKEQWIDEKTGKNIRPHLGLVTNFSKGSQDKPPLLTLYALTIFLHKFGHTLHQTFSNVHYKRISRYNVLYDFVELPSDNGYFCA